MNATDRFLQPDDSTALADGFARRIGDLSRRLQSDPRAMQWAERAAFAVSRATSQGHVCVALAELVEHAGETVSAAREALFASGVACDGEGPAADFLPLVIDAQQRIYLARYFDFERRLARALVGRMQPATFARDPAALKATMTRYFKPSDNTIDWQQVAALVALSGKLTIVSGGPGTGKTTTVVGVLACLIEQNPDVRIALAAPTGKAAQRMQEALAERAGSLPPELAARLPQTSFTLQRLLGSQANGRFRHHRDNPLPYDVIVVDEASMIDVALAAHLLEAVSPDARLVMLGDKDQLAAVEAGAVFAELSAQPVFSVECAGRIADALGVPAERFEASLPSARHVHEDALNPLTDSVVWLERNYRFGLDSAIGRLSVAIRKGSAQDALNAFSNDTAATLVDDSGATLRPSTSSRLISGFTLYADALKQALADKSGAEPLFDALNQFRILAATRHGPRGVDELNHRVSTWVRSHVGITLAAGAQWFAGRPVIVTRNDYALGVFNGDIGIAMPAEDGGLRVWFRAADTSLRAISPAALPTHDTAFALTVHKSQGSEFDRAALVLPSEPGRVLSRELVYTAITRARSRVDVIGGANVFAQAVITPTRRDSGLAARIEEATS